MSISLNEKADETTKVNRAFHRKIGRIFSILVWNHFLFLPLLLYFIKPEQLAFYSEFSRQKIQLVIIRARNHSISFFRNTDSNMHCFQNWCIHISYRRCKPICIFFISLSIFFLLDLYHRKLVWPRNGHQCLEIYRDGNVALDISYKSYTNETWSEY